MQEGSVRENTFLLHFCIFGRIVEGIALLQGITDSSLPFVTFAGEGGV